jgi:hypothetical protein
MRIRVRLATPVTVSPVRKRPSMASADDYVFGGSSPIRFYAHYFDPETLVRNARIIRSSRNDIHSYDALIINQYGDGPVEPLKSRGLFYGRLKAIDPDCFRSLRQMAKTLQAKGKHFSIVMTPLNPEWRSKIGVPTGALATLDAGISKALAGTGAKLLDLEVDQPPDTFFDAIHFRWSATGRFTRAIVAALAHD